MSSTGSIIRGQRRPATTDKTGATAIGIPVRGALILWVLVLVSCAQKQDPALERLLSMEQNGYEGQEPTEERIQELKDAVEEYQEQVERQAEAAGQIGIYYKMLANEYMEREMYGKALESLSQAIYYYPDNPVLHYLAGVGAAHVGASMPSEDQATDYLMQAERSYRRALELDESYVDALYGLAILYAFELEQPREALPLLERLLQHERRNVDAMFLLARVYAAVGRVEDAVEMYDRIIETTQIPARKQRARENRQRLLGGSYEQ